jgi:transposase
MSLTVQQREELESTISVGYDGSVSARARIVLLWDEKRSAESIARELGTTKPTVYKWVRRYRAGGLAALQNETPPGRPREISERDRARIVALTKMSPPAATGLTHWSSHEMARYLRRHEGIEVSHNFVARLWREHSLKPHRQGTFKLSKDPDFAVKVVDIIGLYLDPPAGAVVLSVDEKTQVQALQRTQPLLPISFGKTEKRTHDYLRHGTTNLFAALDTLTGHVIGKCMPRRRTSEFLTFMNTVVAAYPGAPQIHVILDNLSTHSGTDVDAWLAKHPTVTFHFTPTGSSWINQIETWFGIITRQSIRRGNFASLTQLIRQIDNYLTHWNETADPFEWKATADQILEKVTILERDYRKLLANNTK